MYQSFLKFNRLIGPTPLYKVLESEWVKNTGLADLLGCEAEYFNDDKLARKLDYVHDYWQVTGTEQAVLEINSVMKQAQLMFKEEITFVGKEVAERQSLSICKSGFLLQSGERIGIGCDLTISS